MADSKQKAKRQQPTNFLEALRELGRDVATEAKVQVKQVVAQDIPESFGLSQSGTLKPHEHYKVGTPDKAEAATDRDRKSVV